MMSEIDYWFVIACGVIFNQTFLLSLLNLFFIWLNSMIKLLIESKWPRIFSQI
jgi:hypothetical protein